jgi:hypothetical protein
MPRALDRCVIDTRQLASTLDLWLCMWEPEEKERFETAVVRAMTDENPRATRLQALAACHVLSTPRLRAAADRVAAAGRFSAAEVQALAVLAQPWRALLASGERMRGNLGAIEQLLARHVDAPDDPAVDITLDWVDIRDLVSVARTTVDARLFAEVERRIARRGKYQRGRAANLLGFRVQPPVLAQAS